MPDYGIFKTNDAKRIAAATRIVEGLPRSFLGVPQQIANRWNQPGTATTGDTGFPSGVECDCDHCLEGVTIPDGTECCKSHTTWSFTNPWLTCATTDLLLHYAGADRWVSDEFAGPEGDPNTYRWVLTIDVDGVLAGVPNYTALTLVVAQDNGGDPVCLVYGRVGFDCKCDNALTRKKPYGKVHGVELNDTSCNVCLKPEPVETEPMSCSVCFPDTTVLPTTWEVTIAGIGSGSPCSLDNCSILNDTFNLITVDDPALVGLPATFPVAAPFAVAYVGQSSSTSGGVCASTDATYHDQPVYVTLHCDSSGNGMRVSVWIKQNGSDHYNLLSYWITDPNDGCAQAFYTPDFTQTLELTSLGPGQHGTLCGDWPTTVTVLATNPAGPATGSGACEDDDCIPGIPPTNPAGGCCFGGYCLDFIDEALCNDFGGSWSADIDNCLELCNPTGSCCVAGGCFLGTEQVCDLVGGTFVPGAHCDDDPCTDGACCRADGTCEVVPEGDCNGVGDHYYGDGTTCIGKSCLGACCCDDTPCCPGSSYTAEQCLAGPAGEPPCGGPWTFHIDEDCAAACVSTASC